MARDSCLPAVWDGVEETSRQVLQRVPIGMSLAGEAIGSVAIVGGISAAFVGTVFTCCRLRPSEVLRQASGRAAGQAPFVPFHFH